MTAPGPAAIVGAMSKLAVEPGARVALVTGSARGLGKAVAEHLAARGDRVHVVWNSSGALAAELEERFPRPRAPRGPNRRARRG